MRLPCCCGSVGLPSTTTAGVDARQSSLLTPIRSVGQRVWKPISRRRRRLHFLLVSASEEESQRYGLDVPTHSPTRREPTQALFQVREFHLSAVVSCGRTDSPHHSLVSAVLSELKTPPIDGYVLPDRFFTEGTSNRN